VGVPPVIASRLQRIWASLFATRTSRVWGRSEWLRVSLAAITSYPRDSQTFSNDSRQLDSGASQDTR
jgi:hypothetical protein